MQYQPVQGLDGALYQVISSSTDVTVHEQAEGRLAEQQEFYEAVLNLLPVDVTVAVFDTDHRFLFVNPSAISDPWCASKSLASPTRDTLPGTRGSPPRWPRGESSALPKPCAPGKTWCGKNCAPTGPAARS